MKIQKSIATLAAMAALTVTAVMPSMAATTFASATTLSQVYHNRSTGLAIVDPTQKAFTSTANPTTDSNKDSFSFTGLNVVGDAFTSDNIFWNQVLSGGTFTLTDAITSQVLLTGTFTNAVMGGIVLLGNKDANVSFIGVNYTGGAYWTNAQGIGFNNPGDLSLALLAANALAIDNPGGPGAKFHDFNASGTGTFGATQNLGVPEPGNVLAFMIGALGLCALVLRGRKTNSMNGNIA